MFLNEDKEKSSDVDEGLIVFANEGNGEKITSQNLRARAARFSFSFLNGWTIIMFIFTWNLTALLRKIGEFRILRELLTL